MKKALSVVLAIVLCCLSCSALAAGKLSVTQENFHVISDYSNYGYAYAKVENVGDRPICVNAGVLEIYDENGTAITSSDYLHTYAKCLQPGQYTYVAVYDEIEDEAMVARVDDYALTVTGKTDKTVATLRLPCETDLKLNVENGWWTYNYMYATITNNTETPLYDISIIFALLDGDGNILYMDDDSLYADRALMPGSSMIIRCDISSSFMDYFSENSFVPASVDAIAYVDLDIEE